MGTLDLSCSFQVGELLAWLRHLDNPNVGFFKDAHQHVGEVRLFSGRLK